MGNAPPDLDDAATTALRRLNYRVVLSGMGGDEFTGGVPDPRPLLADLLMKFRWRTFTDQLMVWSLVKKTPWIQILFRSLGLLLPLSVRARWNKQNHPERWIGARFVGPYWHAIHQLAQSEDLGFRLPTQRDHAQVLVGIARQMSIAVPPLWGCQEKRYPYLDQTLVEFIVSIPADQLLQPGQRRFLMRRALAKLLPPEILSRTTKATAKRRPMAIFEAQWPQIENLFRSSVSSRLGFINSSIFLDDLAAAKKGNAPRIDRLLRGLSLELWLRDLVARGVLLVPTLAQPSTETSLAAVKA